MRPEEMLARRLASEISAELAKLTAAVRGFTGWMLGDGEAEA